MIFYKYLFIIFLFFFGIIQNVFSNEICPHFFQFLERESCCLSSKFTQKIYSESGKVIQKIEGNFRLHEKNFFWWEVEYPYQLLRLYDENIYFYDKELQQLMVYRVDQYKSYLVDVLIDVTKSKDHIEQLSCSKEKNFFRYQLKIKDDAILTESFELLFKDRILQQIIFFDSSKNKIVISMHDLTDKVRFTKQDFKWEIPENIDLLDYR